MYPWTWNSITGATIIQLDINRAIKIQIANNQMTYLRVYICHEILCEIWQYGWKSFQTGNTKLERFLPMNQRASRKLLNFEFCQKEPKFDFQSQLCMWKIIRIFLRLFFIKEYQVRNTFFVINVCCQNILLNHFIHKMMPYFNSSPLIKNSKFHNSIISFWYVDSFAKISVIFLILSPTPLENSTTRIAIVWNTVWLCRILNFATHSLHITGKSFSEALIFESINPKYNDRLFIKLQVQNMIWMSKQKPICIHSMLQLAMFMYWSRNLMNNQSSYCGLIDSRMSASEKDLPVFT